MAKKKNPGGRPTIWTEEKVLELGEDLITWLKASDENVWFERFLYEEKDLYPQFISEMRDKYPKFSELLKRAKKIQENKIVDGTFKHNLNATMAIFVLKNHYQYTDKQQTEITIQEQPFFKDDDEKEE
jgi:alpha-galactosidase/6-phospho-beta-glucosidase family protein